MPALAKLPEDDRSRQATSTVLRAVRSARTVARRAQQPPAQVEAAAKRAATEAVKRIRRGDIASKVKDGATKIGRAAKLERSPVEISQFFRHDGLRTRVRNLALETDSLLGEVWPYRDQLDDAADRAITAASTYLTTPDCARDSSAND